MHSFLQIWGGLFYLLNKIFLSFSERTILRKRQYRIFSWIFYLVGLPAWVNLFILERNWIAGALEAGGAPSMFLGLLIAIKGTNKYPKWIEKVSLVSIALGLFVSWYDFGGINMLTQLLEILIVFGFLVGTYLVAKQKPTGYLFFLIMNLSCGLLMYLQDYFLLAVQQVISLSFVMDAYINSIGKKESV